MLKRIGFYVFVMLLFIYLQLSSTVNQYFSLKGVMPDFILLVLILLYQYGDEFETLILAFTTGLIIDSFSGHLFGLNALCYTVIVYIYSKFKSVLYVRNLMFYLFLVLLALIIKLFFYYLFGFLFKEVFIIWRATLVNYLLHIVYTLLIAPFVYMLLTLQPVLGILAKRTFTTER